MTEITQEYLKECFYYDFFNGCLVWKDRPKSHFKENKAYGAFKRFIGKSAGSKSFLGKKAYIRITLKTKSLMAHRLIWLFIHGAEAEEIDHIDGNGCNNKIENLRSVSRVDNARNQKKFITNTSGVTGVYKIKDQDKWYSQIRINGKLKSLGTYKNIDDAINARRVAESEYGFHENHGIERDL